MTKPDYNKIASFKIERKKKTILGLKERNPKYTFDSLKVITAKDSKYFENVNSSLAVTFNGGKLHSEVKDKEVKDLVFMVDAYLAEQKLRVKSEYVHEDVINEELDLRLIFNCDNFSEEKVKKITKTVVRHKQPAIARISIIKNEKYNKTVLYDTIKDDFGILVIENIAEGHAHPLELRNIAFILQDSSGRKIGDESTFILDAPEIMTINPGGKHENFFLNIDISKLPHPAEEQEYTIIISGEKKTANKLFSPINYNEDFAACSFKVAPNRKDTDLFLKVNGDDKTECNSISVNEIAYDLESVMNTKIIADIQLGNRSDVYDETNNDYLEITNLSISKTISPVNNRQDNEAFKQQIREIVKVGYRSASTKKWTEILQKAIPCLTLENGKNAFVNLKIKVDPKDFKTLDSKLENKTNIDVILSFNYTIRDKEGRIKHGPRPKNYKISFQIRQYEGDKWLAIDYGTSAIVVQYGTAASNNLESNVKLQFKALVEDNDDTYVQEDYDETDDALLSSTIALRKNKSLSGKFNDSIVSISPRQVNISSGDEYLLPYLKSLIGHEKLPSDFLRLIQEETLKSLQPIDIIEEAYTILLNSLVIPAYEGIRKNKIILTIPNSFTTLHKKILRSIVKLGFKDVWDDYIVFVSESDAVAWYYIDHFFPLLQYATDSAQANLRKEKPLKDEIVLAYDMGAGTLDLTLFRIQKESGQKKITVLGKIGQISGGNYADYVIGKEFWNQVDNKDKDKYDPMKKGHSDGFSNEKIKYRTFIRNKIKPAMSTLDQSKITENNFYGEYCTLPQVVNFESLIQSDAYNDYLAKNTTTILTLLKSTFGLGSNVKIDTLVLSGRGVQLRGLQEALQNAIKEQFIGSDPLTIQIKKENLKTIVSEGAIYYATRKASKNIIFKPLSIAARYGILRRITGQRYEYEEVLNSDSPSVTHINFNDTYFEGTMVEKELGTLSEVEEVIVIQTYLQKEMILGLLNDISSTREKSLEHYHQSSSHIIAFNRNKDFDSMKNKIIIAIDTESEVYIQFNNSVKTEFVVPASDMENLEFFKKPMWYLF